MRINMKLKYKLLSVILGSSLLFASGCTEEFLQDAIVEQQLDANTFYQSEEHAIAASNAMYSPLHWQGLFKRHRYMLDFMSGDLIPTSGANQLMEYPEFRFNPTTQNFIPRAWEACYVGISRANVVLEQVPEIQFSQETEEMKTRILGEAKFLRGFYYFNLVRLYGGVPLYTESFSGGLDDPMFQPERNTEEEVYAQIEKDFMDAAATLPLAYEGDDIGRATAGAAQAFLGKVYLYQQKYGEARTALKKVIDGEFGDYALVPFNDNFLEGTENNVESLFEIQQANVAGTNPWRDKDDPIASRANWVASALSPRNGGGFANGLPSPEVNAFFNARPEENAVRRYFTIARPGDVWANWNPIAPDPVAAKQWHVRAAETNGEPFSAVRKFVKAPNDWSPFNQVGTNFRVMRYAEVLLLFAEAENEVNGPTAEAYSAINQVRERAQVDVLPAGLDKEAFFERIVTERRLELTFEFQRFFDLVRWGKRANVPAIADPAQMPGFVKGKNEVLPIPEEEIIANPNLAQNPNY
ncbi:RagB/SusD family nutrient uptake outer membrane protein [Algivirga pacifica]|uniref:RagB/SusD family nutrient uptake outer membrane protein n=1 Tax=Algivirga pacifica TaxID=1162670 RepID=A0ABP9DDV2_9BACT